jgi:hypothetical protein
MMLLALAALLIGALLTFVIGVFIVDGRRAVARTGLELVTLAVCAVLFSVVLHVGSGAIGF